MAGVMVPSPVFTVIYDDKDITTDIAAYVLSVSVTDKLTGESDEMELSIEDSDGRWMRNWYPDKGAQITLLLGYSGAPLRLGGTFSVDEIELNGPPAVVTIRGIAASTELTLRSGRSQAYENRTLADIARHVASAHGLRVEGKIDTIPIDRVTQFNETDLGFIQRLSSDYGYTVKVTHDALVFTHFASLYDGVISRELQITDVGSFNFRDTVNRIYKSGRLKHQNAKSRTLVVYGVDANGNTRAVGTQQATDTHGVQHTREAKPHSNDVLAVRDRASNSASAKTKVTAAVNRHNKAQKTGSLTLSGDLQLRAGRRIHLGSTFGVLSGSWLVSEARHTFDRSSGFVTEIGISKGDAIVHTPPANTREQLVVYGVKKNGSTGVVREENKVKK